MADSRLQWRQVAGPNFSGVSAAMARANDSFNRGLDAAGGIFEKYAAGQEELADNALLSDLAGLGDEAEFDAFIDNGGLNGRGISKGMRDHVLGMRTGFINDDGTRARTASTRAGTGIRLAQESRNAAEYMDKVSRRDAERAAAPSIGAAQEFARANGDTVGPITEVNQLSQRELLARTLQAEAGNQGLQGMLDVGSVMRNRVASGRWGGDLGSVILAPGQFSAWNGVTGYAGGEQGQDMLNMSVGEEAYAAADAILSGNYEDRTGGATHYVNDSISQPAWLGQLNANGATRLGAHLFGNPDNANRYTGNTGPIGASTNVNVTSTRQSPVQAARAELEATGRFTAAEIDNMLAGVTEAGETRAKEQAASDANLVAEQNAQSLQDILTDPNITNSTDAVQAVLNRPGFTAAENAAAVEDMMALINETTTEDGGSILSPTVGATDDSRTDAAAAAAVNAEIERRQQADPQAQAIRDASAWAEDPTAGLVEQLGLGTDGQNPGAVLGIFGESGFDDNQLRNMIRDTARRNGISEAQAAAAMAQAFDRDPGWFDGKGNGGWRNTLANRFPEEEVDRIAGAYFGKESHSRGVENILNDRTTQSELAGAQSLVTNLEAQVAKAEGATKAALQKQLDAARERLRDIVPAVRAGEQ